jgi:hypothetical protein
VRASGSVLTERQTAYNDSNWNILSLQNPFVSSFISDSTKTLHRHKNVGKRKETDTDIEEFTPSDIVVHYFEKKR